MFKPEEKDKPQQNYLSVSSSSNKTSTKKWPEEVLNFDDIKKYYEQAYGYAIGGDDMKPDYSQAAICIMQAPEVETISLSTKVPVLTYEQLCAVIKAKPACASRLLADHRHLALFDNLHKVIDYLKLAPHTAELLLDNDEVLRLVPGHTSLGKVLQVAPKAIDFLLYTKQKIKVINYEANLLDLAKLIPDNMLQLLKNNNLSQLIKTGYIFADMIGAAPELVKLLEEPKFCSIMHLYLIRQLELDLQLQAKQGVTRAQKALGDLYWKGLWHFSKDENKALEYYNMAADKDQESADIVGKFYLTHVENILQRGCWENIDKQMSYISFHLDKIPPLSSSYRESLIIYADIILGAGPDRTFLLKKQYRKLNDENLRAALPYLIKAYELNISDDRITRQLDQVLNSLYLEGGILQDPLEEDVRQELIEKFKSEENNQSSLLSRICCYLF